MKVLPVARFWPVSRSAPLLTPHTGRLLCSGRGRGGYVALLVASLFLTAVASFGFETDPAKVDRSAALSVDGTEISRYIFDKNYNLFVAGFQNSHHRTPNADETAEWFSVFVAQMTLKTQLARAGYLDRPDIADNVARMSRYILTKLDGPLYQTMYDRQAIPPERVQNALAMAKRTFDAFLVRFENDDAARRELGPTGDIAGFSSRGARGQSDGTSTDLHDGLIYWPYHPFEEISEDLARAEPGQALGPIHRGLGVYYAMVRRLDLSGAHGPAGSPEEMERALKFLDDNLVRRRHRAGILREARFLVSVPTVESALALLLSVPGPSPLLPPEVWAPLSGATLASYERDGVSHRITGQDFAKNLNRLVLPRKPGTVGEFITALQDMLVEECDHRTARQLQLDREPKFLEDQRNYALNQVLAAFEQETLLPRLRPTQDELRDYAAAHREAYLTSVESSGTLYIFAERAHAEAAAIRMRPADFAAAVTHAVQKIDPFVVRRDGPQLMASLPNGAVLAAAEGTVLGPLTYIGQPAVFLKRASGDRVALSFAEIEHQVGRDYLRAKLDEAVVELFRGNPARASLQVHLDPRKYGLSAFFVRDSALPSASTPDFRSGQASALVGVSPSGSDQTIETKKIKHTHHD